MASRYTKTSARAVLPAVVDHFLRRFEYYLFWPPDFIQKSKEWPQFRHPKDPYKEKITGNTDESADPGQKHQSGNPGRVKHQLIKKLQRYIEGYSHDESGYGHFYRAPSYIPKAKQLDFPGKQYGKKNSIENTGNWGW